MGRKFARLGSAMGEQRRVQEYVERERSVSVCVSYGLYMQAGTKSNWVSSVSSSGNKALC